MAALYQIADRVQSKLRIDSPHAAALIPEWLNIVYSEVCTETECLQLAATTTLSSGFATYAMPIPVMRLKSITPSVAGYPRVPLEETSVEDILRKRAGSALATGWVSAYAVAGQDVLEFWPTPASDTELLVYYVQQPYPLALHEGPLIPEPYGSRLLEYGALVQAADWLGDPQDEPKYQALYDRYLANFQRHLTRRKGGHTTQLKMAERMFVVPSDRSADLPYWG